jgi:hypothetical protein
MSANTSNKSTEAHDEAELYAHRAMRRFNLTGKVTSGLSETVLAKVPPKAAREAITAYCESLAEELVTQAYRDGKKRVDPTVAAVAEELGWLVADRAGNICTLEGTVLFTGDPEDAARLVVLVNAVIAAVEGKPLFHGVPDEFIACRETYAPFGATPVRCTLKQGHPKACVFPTSWGRK